MERGRGMPPKAKFTKEEIMEAALRIVKKIGRAHV